MEFFKIFKMDLEMLNIKKKSARVTLWDLRLWKVLEFYIKLYHITIVTDLANDIDEITPPPSPQQNFEWIQCSWH